MARDVTLRLSPRRMPVALAGLLAAATASPFAAAHAAPLPPETCDAMRGEVTLLEGGGAGANIERGVEWGKANLSPEQIRYVARLIALREQVAFRCRPALIEMPTPPLPPPAPEPVDADKVPLPARRQQAAGAAAAPAGRPSAAADAKSSTTKPDGAKKADGLKKLDGVQPGATVPARSSAVPPPAPKPLVEAPVPGAGTARQ